VAIVVIQPLISCHYLSVFNVHVHISVFQTNCTFGYHNKHVILLWI